MDWSTTRDAEVLGSYSIGCCQPMRKKLLQPDVCGGHSLLEHDAQPHVHESAPLIQSVAFNLSRMLSYLSIFEDITPSFIIQSESASVSLEQ